MATLTYSAQDEYQSPSGQCLHYRSHSHRFKASCSCPMHSSWRLLVHSQCID